MNSKLSQNDNSNDNNDNNTIDIAKNSKKPIVCIEIAKYSDVEVYECFIKGAENQIVMRRIKDDWVNITQIFKIANYSKAKRTKILEIESINFTFFEKIQGGYGKFQGTWVPMNDARLIVYKYNINNIIVNKLLNFTLDPNNPPFKRLKNTMKRTSSTNISNNPSNNTTLLAKNTQRKIVTNNLLAENLDLSLSYLRKSNPIDNNKIHDNIQNPQYYALPFNTTMDKNLVKKEETNHYKEIISTVKKNNLTTKIKTKSKNKSRSNTKKDSNKGSNIPNKYIGTASGQSNAVLRAINDYKSTLLNLLSIEDFNNSQFQDKLNRILILPEGLNINFPIDNQNHTALHWATSMGNLPLVEALVFKLSANPLVTNIIGFNCITKSIFYNNCYNLKVFNQVLNILKICLITPDNNGRLPLHYLVELTIDKFKDQRIINFYMDSILNFVSNNSRQLLIKCLNFPDHSGNTVFHLAALNSNWILCNKFFNLGASIDVVNLNNETPMMIMSRNNTGHGDHEFLNTTLGIVNNGNNNNNTSTDNNNNNNNMTISTSVDIKSIENIGSSGNNNLTNSHDNHNNHNYNHNHNHISAHISDNLPDNSMSNVTIDNVTKSVTNSIPQNNKPQDKSQSHTKVNETQNKITNTIKIDHIPTFSTQSTLDLDLPDTDTLNLNHGKFTDINRDRMISEFNNDKNANSSDINIKNATHLNDHSSLNTILEDITVFDNFESSVVIKDQPNTTIDYLQQSPTTFNKKRKVTDNNTILNYLKTPKIENIETNSVINFDSNSKLSHGTPILNKELNYKTFIKKQDISESIKQLRKMTETMTHFLENNIDMFKYNKNTAMEKIIEIKLETETINSRYNTMINSFTAKDAGNNVSIETSKDGEKNDDRKNSIQIENKGTVTVTENENVNKDLAPIMQSIEEYQKKLETIKLEFLQYIERNQALELAILVQEEETAIKSDTEENENGNENENENDEKENDDDNCHKNELSKNNKINENDKENDEINLEEKSKNANGPIELAIKLTLLQFKRKLEIKNICGIKCTENVTDNIVKYKKLIGSKIQDIDRTLDEIENDLNDNNK